MGAVIPMLSDLSDIFPTNQEFLGKSSDLDPTDRAIGLGLSIELRRDKGCQPVFFRNKNVVIELGDQYNALA